MSLHTALQRSALTLIALAPFAAMAQSHSHSHDHPAAPPAAAMDHSTMDHSSMDHSSMDHSDTAHEQGDDSTGAAHRQATPALPRVPIPAVTDADRVAAFPPIRHDAMQHAPSVHSLLRVDRLEHGEGRHGSSQAWEASGWIGGDINRLWLRSEGERNGGRTGTADVELLYGRSISPWWDVVAGMKQDVGTGPSRSWAALGIQGLAPYKFETAATLYLGSGGQVMAKAEVEYEVLLTNRLVLQPMLEATLAARDEPERGIGRGVNKAEAGLRLRYEFSRRFAPYIGITHERRFGDSADHADATGDHARDKRWVAGIRMWF
ncbi:copper resistance protein B [Stenotrophomonas sp. 169]|uniref:copper resistance protein B n=1 Tax=Stenotrophomonas sp. 169 TaxID=2770322 RepID=UPI001662721E|nr:copper resistance protein B [Stenotrophomonas sp. 169]QNR96508.1 copper resistance protein B [Stenotrophomonas sp. 169]